MNRYVFECSHVTIITRRECGGSRASRRLPDRGRADCPLCAIPERVGDEPRVAPELPNRRPAQPALVLPGSNEQCTIAKDWTSDPGWENWSEGAAMNLANARAQLDLHASSHGAAQLAGVFCGHNEIAHFTYHEPQLPRVVPANPIDQDIRRRCTIIEHELFVFPMSVEFEKITDREVIASFPEAGIAISGDDEDDALDSLIIVLRETLEDFLAEEDNLGPEPRRQLGILRACLRL